MMLLAFAMEVGAGLALHDAWRLGSGSGEDLDKLNQKREAVCHEMVDRIHRLTALENAPQAFVHNSGAISTVRCSMALRAAH